MRSVFSGEKAYAPRKMDFYVDRGSDLHCKEIADQCVNGIFVLWKKVCLDCSDCDGNVFCHQFDGNEVILKREYLFSMDYLTNVIGAYQRTKAEIYRDTFEKVIMQFHAYLETSGPFYDDLPVYAQTLLLIKALDVLGSIPYQKDFMVLLRKYADWLMDDDIYENDNNHGMFQNIALLHLGVLLSDCPDAVSWQKKAIMRINRLYDDTYYDDFTNHESSLRYFDHNNYLYDEAVQFCTYYGIDGIAELAVKLNRSKDALITFAHLDGSFPPIGDGRVFNREKRNAESRLFPGIGIAVLKVGELYLSFKCKTIYQCHAHEDISSVTARYKDIDFLLDTGQYNYDRYTPINRYVRSPAGHSGIFPLFADNLFQWEFVDLLQSSEITAYEHSGDKAFVQGEYRLRDASVRREILLSEHTIIVRDRWDCETPAVMRQRFVLPRQLIGQARFTASERKLESTVGKVRFRFEISSDLPQLWTSVSFGVAAPQYYAYEETMLLDTFAENALSGEITAKITFGEVME